MKLYAINEFHSKNVGDQAIAAGLRAILGEFSLSVKFLGLESEAGEGKQSAGRGLRKILSNWPLALMALRRVYLPIWVAKRYRSIRRHTNSIFPSDLVMIGGGGVLMNNNYHFPIALATWAYFLRKRRVPYYVIGVSTSGNLNAIAKFFIKRCLGGAAAIYVRDEVSQNEIARQFSLSSQLCPDLAFGLPLATSRKRPGHCIGINVSAPNHNFTRDSYRNYLASLAGYIKRAALSAPVSLFTTGEPDDQFYAESLYESLKGLCEVKLEARPENVDDLLAVIDKYSFTVCSRLHSAVLSLVRGASPLMVAYDKKALGLFNTLGLSELVVTHETLGASDGDPVHAISGALHESQRSRLLKLVGCIVGREP